MQPYNNCPEWDDLSGASKQERKKFDQTEFMSNVIYNVSRRLGFDYNLTQGEILLSFLGNMFSTSFVSVLLTVAFLIT